MVSFNAASLSIGKAVAGFLLSGFLFALLGAILPAWGYHLKSDFAMVGNYFLSLSAGVIAASQLAAGLISRRGVSFVLVFACALACGALIYLALVTPPRSGWWRMAGLLPVGVAMGLLNAALFQAITPNYRRDPAATVNLGGVFYGMGCLAVVILVAGTFYAYTVPSILILAATVPGFTAGIYARGRLQAAVVERQPTIGDAMRDLRSPGAVILALLLFFQLGNEWSIAGWLPVFLIRRLGVSPATSLLMLAFYWIALLAGRVAAISALPRVRHGKLLGGSVLAALFGCALLLSTNNLFGAASGILIVGVGFAGIYPLVAERIGRRFPYYNPGLFNGIFSFALIGGILAPATLGYAVAVWGIGIVMALPLLGTCMVCLLLPLSWLESKVTGR